MASARAFAQLSPANWLHGAWKSNVAPYGVSSTYEEHCGAERQPFPRVVYVSKFLRHSTREKEGNIQGTCR